MPTYFEDLLHAQVSLVMSELFPTYLEDLLHAQISQVMSQLVPSNRRFKCKGSCDQFVTVSTIA